MLKLVLIFIITFTLYAKGNSIDKATIHLDWLHQFQFAGYYIAKEKGYFKENNLDITFKEYSKNLNLYKKVTNNSATYGVGKSSLIIEHAKNNDLLFMFSAFQNSPMILITTNKNIKKVKDLKNKKIMITRDAKDSASIFSMLKSNELDNSNINIQEHSFKLDDLIDKKVDAMACYSSNEPFNLYKKNVNHTVFDPKDYGFDFYEGILFTSQKEYEENPIRVEKIYRSVKKGWKYAFDNIEETAKIIYEKYNSQNKSLDSLIYEGKVLKTLAYKKDTALGEIKKEKIEEIRRLYTILGFKNLNNLKIDKLIYKKEKTLLNKKEIEYLENNTITFLTNTNYPPLTIHQNGTLNGIEIDFIRLIEKKINKKIDYKIFKTNKKQLEYLINTPNSFKYKYSQLDDNENLTVSDSIDKIKIALVTNIDTPYIENINLLNKKTIAVIKYSSTRKILEYLYPNFTFVYTKNLDESLKLLSENKVYGLFGKLPVLSYKINTNHYTNMKISGAVPSDFNMKLVINKKADMLSTILNKAISNITEEEKFNITSKYNLIKYEAYVDYSWIYKASIPLLIIIIIILIINVKLQKEIKKRKIAENRLLMLVNIDSLTNIFNRRKIDELYKKEFYRAKRYNNHFSIIFFDINDFKYINDTFGHKIGDEVLINISKIVKENIRETDYYGRWGGDEFIILLPQTTQDEAKNVVEHIKKELNKFNKTSNYTPISCSFGTSQYEKNDTYDSLLTKVDDKMYLEKTKK